MQDSADQYLDEAIKIAVRHNTHVTLKQHLRAKETLLKAAAQQTMLPPVISPVASPDKRIDFNRILLNIVDDMRHFIMDEGLYHRARSQRGIQAKFTFSSLAKYSEFVLQFRT